MRECEKGCPKAWATVKIKTSIFHLQYISHGQTQAEVQSNDLSNHV